MSWLTAVSLVGFVALALICIDTLGPPLGAVAWLLAYGAFRLICRIISAFIGDPADITQYERRP